MWLAFLVNSRKLSFIMQWVHIQMDLVYEICIQQKHVLAASITSL